MGCVSKVHRQELKKKCEAIDTLRKETRRKMVTLLFAANDTEHNNAVVLRLWLAKK